jgi:hypothetical protein
MTSIPCSIHTVNSLTQLKMNDYKYSHTSLSRLSITDFVYSTTTMDFDYTHPERHI